MTLYPYYNSKQDRGNIARSCFLCILTYPVSVGEGLCALLNYGNFLSTSIVHLERKSVNIFRTGRAQRPSPTQFERIGDEYWVILNDGQHRSVLFFMVLRSFHSGVLIGLRWPLDFLGAILCCTDGPCDRFKAIQGGV